MGTFLGSLPDQGATLSHTGKGIFTINNYSDRFRYWVVLGTLPTDPSGGVVEGNTITTNTPTATYTMFVGKKVGDPDPDRSLETRFYRQARTYYSYGCLDQRYNPCGDCSNPSGAENGWSWSCGCYGGDAGGGQWGPCICRKGATCTAENTYPGYSKGYDEWYKIDAPEISPKAKNSVKFEMFETPTQLTNDYADAPFIHSFLLGTQVDRENPTGVSYTKFADAVMEVYLDNKLVDVITSSEEFHFEIADDTAETRITLFSADLPVGIGTFDLQVVDSYGSTTYEEQGEWRND